MESRKSIVSSFVHQAAVSCMVLRKFEKWPPNKHSAKKTKRVRVSLHTTGVGECGLGHIKLEKKRTVSGGELQYGIFWLKLQMSP